MTAKHLFEPATIEGRMKNADSLQPRAISSFGTDDKVDPECASRLLEDESNESPYKDRKRKNSDEYLGRGPKSLILKLTPSHFRRTWRSHGRPIKIAGLLLVAFIVILANSTQLNKIVAILPPTVSYYTKPFPGLTKDNRSPKGWKPPFRVVVSLTTVPYRLDKIGSSIDSLLDQSLQVDMIYLNVPQGPMKRHPERSYDEAEIPQNILNNERVTVTRAKDYGPATKLIPTLYHEDDPETLIITVDDDWIYPYHHIAALAWEAHHRENDALGVCGWGAMPRKELLVHVYVPYWMRPNGRYVDVLQACCGNAYRRRFFSDVSLLSDMPPVCTTVDDVWIAGYLAVHESIDRAVISKQVRPAIPDWKKEEKKSDNFNMRLSTYNHKFDIHLKCVEAIEGKLKKKWSFVSTGVSDDSSI